MEQRREATNATHIECRVHAPECIMGNQRKMERNSKFCKKVQNDENYSCYAILGFFIFQNRRYALKGARGRIILERMAIVERVSALHFL